MLPPTQPGSDTLTHVGLHGNNPLASTQGCSPKRGRVSEAGAAQLSSFHGGRGTHPQMLDAYRAVQVTTTCEGQLKFSGRICVRGGGGKDLQRKSKSDVVAPTGIAKNKI